MIHERFERARAEAAAASPERAGAGPFRGVPFLVKDAVCHTAGDPVPLRDAAAEAAAAGPSPTTRGSRRGSAPPGFVFVGKTNTPELATSVTTEPLAYGADAQSVGPHAFARRFERRRRPRRSRPGMVAVAHGNDMGGSIRFPASMCGIVGLKPTRARTTLGPDFGEYWGPLTHEHVLTRSVRDTAAVLDAVAGAGARRSVHRAAAGAPVPRRGRRAARAAAHRAPHPAARRIESAPRVRRRGRREPAGCSSHSVITSSPSTFPRSTSRVDDAFGIVMIGRGSRATSRGGAARTGVEITADDVEPGNLFLARDGRDGDAASTYAGAIERMQAWSRRRRGRGGTTTTSS